MKTRWKFAAIAAVVLFILEAGLLLTGKRILIDQDFVRPGEDYTVSHYGNLKNNSQASLVCKYFTGRHLVTEVVWNSSNNLMGRDECPFISEQAKATNSRIEVGSIADWFAGIATLLATGVALFSYRWIDRQRMKDERQRRQDSAYQIGYKLATLMTDAITAHKALIPNGTTLEELKKIDNPFELVSQQQPAVGFGSIMARDLTDTEQNLLMSLREENFLMDMSETFARNETIREGIGDYKLKHEAITAMLPPPIETSGQMASLELTQQQQNALWPYFMPAATLLTSMRDLSELNLVMLRRMGQGFHAMMHKHYPDLHIHKIEDVTEEALKA
jgi:hypothetical protein